ncbi:MAG: hypothetical protein ABI775_01005 [Pseudonocardiales bacterium]|nr:hypothetical protein [Actinomycetota bacterium]
MPVSFAAIAIAADAPAIKRVFATPPATPHAVTIGWYTITAAALVLTPPSLPALGRPRMW